MTNPRVIDILREAPKEEFNLSLICISGHKGLHNEVVNAINRPGLSLTQNFYEFGEQRIQLFGRGEIAYLRDMESKGMIRKVLDALFQHTIPCCIVPNANEVSIPKTFIEICEEHNCPLLLSDLLTYELNVALFRILTILFSEKKHVHGTFLEVFDIGVLIQGKSGVGKSEVALELLEKDSHRLVADDVVELQKIEGNYIQGKAIKTSSQYKHHIEIRGIGIINIAQIFGISSTIDKKVLSLVITLLDQNVGSNYETKIDRLGENKTVDILGVSLPNIEMIVKPGRNISMLIEVATLQHRIRLMGYHGKEDPFLW